MNTAQTAQHSTIMHLAQGRSAIFMSSLRPKKNLVIWCHILGCLTCVSPRALHLPHSLFLLRHKNTQHNRYNKSNSENTSSTRNAIKDQSVVTNSRLAETRATQLPQVMKTKIMETGAGSEGPEELEPKRVEPDKSLQTDLYQLYEIPEKWKNLGKLATNSPTSYRRCISIRTLRKALQNQILKMEEA